MIIDCLLVITERAAGFDRLSLLKADAGYPAQRVAASRDSRRVRVA
jgi:hypothetical protein